MVVNLLDHLPHPDYLPPGFAKLNYDGASRGNPGIFGAGVVIRNSDGNIIRAAYKKLPPDSNNVVEIEALLHGLTLATFMNIPSIIVEGDSKVVFNIVSSRQTSSWKLRYRLDMVLDKLTSFQSFEIKHCFREANMLANVLANKVIDDPILQQEVVVSHLLHLI
ncbi:hypothetical protein SUGI_0737390 [Cryptomeria japonica]|nr:hypothetical protein SUGI_0737390 [Cryptomeria japonica]